MQSIKDKKILRLTIIVFSIVGAFLVRDSRGVDSITWNNIYSVNDFNSFAKIIHYVENLKIPIPIILSLTEIATCNIFGSTFLITHICYRIALVLCFILAIYLSSSSYAKMLISVVLSVVFLWSTVIIHPGNPQTYDIFFPLFNLLYISSLKYAVSQTASPHSPKKMALICFASGFFLSMAELLRPFMFFLLPLLLFCSYQALRNFPIKYFFCFLLPIALFSGVWHVNIALQHGQITWTNNSGQNLIRAWPMVEIPMLVAETHNQPLATNRWPNLNTTEHYQNSQIIQKAVLKYILKHPVQSTVRIVHRLTYLLSVKTSIYYYKPNHWIFWIYKLFVKIACFWLFINILLLSIGFVKYHRLQVFGIAENILIILTLLYVSILAIGEVGEEAKLLISVLPLLVKIAYFGLFINVLLASICFAKYYRLQVFGIAENILIILTLLYVFILAIGEAGEEARFLISVLPLLAALPSCCIFFEKGKVKTVEKRLITRADSAGGVSNN
jgi:hypothetical protein